MSGCEIAAIYFLVGGIFGVVVARHADDPRRGRPALASVALVVIGWPLWLLRAALRAR